MGGYGSGRWHYIRTNAVVENCITLSIYDLAQHIKLGKGTGTIETKPHKFGVIIETSQHRGIMTIAYSAHDNAYNAVVHLSQTKPNYGGVRWWFHCPKCNRRCAKIYLPFAYGRLTWGCRQCHRLTYRSSTNSSARDSMYRRIMRNQGAAGIMALLDAGDYRAGMFFLSERWPDRWGE